MHVPFSPDEEATWRRIQSPSVTKVKLCPAVRMYLPLNAVEKRRQGETLFFVGFFLCELQQFAVSEEHTIIPKEVHTAASIAFALKEGRNCNSAPCLFKWHFSEHFLACIMHRTIVFFVCRCVHYMYCIVGVASKCHHVYSLISLLPFGCFWRVWLAVKTKKYTTLFSYLWFTLCHGGLKLANRQTKKVWTSSEFWWDCD